MADQARAGQDVEISQPLPTGTNSIGTVRTADGQGNAFNASGPGFLRVTDEPAQLFYEPFDGAVLDTINRWTTQLSSGTVTQSSGQLALVSGTTSGFYASTRSQFSFVPTVPAWLGFSFAINLPDGAAPTVTGNRFWGAGSVPTTPTASVPITDGVGFEMLNGKLYAVVYAAGVRTQIADLSSTGTNTQPLDTANHRYIVQVRTDRTYWYIDSLATPVATSSFQAPAVQTLPLVMQAVSAGTSVTLNSSGAAVWDTGKNSIKIRDGIYPWRTGRVTAAGEVYTTDSNRIKQAVAIASSGRLTVAAAADAAGVGRVYLINPVGSAVLIEVRRVEFSSVPTAATAFVTSPRVTVDRFTFTGTASGATITPVQRDTTDSALVGSLRTILTGMTITAGATAYGFTVVPILTAVGAAVPVLQEWEPAENGRIVLRAGQGIMIRQADAGSTSDTRSFVVNLAWAEFTVMT